MTMNPSAKGFDTVAARIAKSEGVPMNVAQGLLSGKLKYPPNDKAAKAKAQSQAAHRLLKKHHKKGQVPPQFLKAKKKSTAQAPPNAPNFPQKPDNSSQNGGNIPFPFLKGKK